MSYPGIFPPGGTPCFLADGHAIDEYSVYAEVPMGTGHGRARRKCTVAPRVVAVSWVLDAAQMAAVDLWFEEDLLVGERHFSAQVANQGPGQLWWDAVWLEPYTADPFPARSGIFWKVTGRLYLNGVGIATRPDDGILAVEFSLPLEGSAVILGDTALVLEIVLPLLPGAPFEVEFSLPLLGDDLGGTELREDGGIELREDGGIELRE